MDFQSNIPIYIQLMDVIKNRIVSGQLQPGEKLPSVRDLALEYGVNPNTMQKALSELEWEKLLYTMRTAGRYVTEDAQMIQHLKSEQAMARMKETVATLQNLGIDREEAASLLEMCWETCIYGDEKNGITGSV